MKVWSDTYVFNFPWETVVQAAFRKYPTKYNSNVKCLDTLERRVGREGELWSHRLFATVWNLPTIIWSLQKVANATYMYVHEQSLCDTNHKTLTVSAMNVSLRNFFQMKEELHYSVHPDDPTKTLLQQKTVMDVQGIPLLGDILESMFINSYESVIAKGRLAIEEKSDLISKET